MVSLPSTINQNQIFKLRHRHSIAHSGLEATPPNRKRQLPVATISQKNLYQFIGTIQNISFLSFSDKKKPVNCELWSESINIDIYEYNIVDEKFVKSEESLFDKWREWDTLAWTKFYTCSRIDKKTWNLHTERSYSKLCSLTLNYDHCRSRLGIRVCVHGKADMRYAGISSLNSVLKRR